MKKLFLYPLIAVAAGCAPPEPVELTAREQTQLAETLRGRTEGQSVSCVSMRNLDGTNSIGEGAIVFGRGSTIYVNRPAAGCPELGPGRALVTRTTSTQLCRGDIGQVIDPLTGMSYGGCALGDFTPYTRTN